jgi:DNA-binding transcriptional LysR family regulator
MKQPRTPRLSLDLLRGFRAAARHLSFTRAAHELFVTQSAISREVSKLEEQLGTPLFARVNRTLRLTQAGEHIYRAADEALSLIDSAAAQVAGTGRTFSITASVPFASLWLGPRLPGFARQHPEISLRIVATNDTVDVAREQIDVAIRYTVNSAAPPSQLKIFDYEVFPVCSPVLARDPARPIRAAVDLANHVRLDFETVRNGKPWYDWQQWLDAKQIRGLKPSGSSRFSHFDQVVEAVIAGSGVAIGRWPHLARHLRDGVLVAPLGDASAATLGGFYLVAAETAQQSTVEAFVTWLRAEAQEDDERRHKLLRSGRRASKK